jgi:hypothetical protein
VTAVLVLPLYLQATAARLLASCRGVPWRAAGGPAARPTTPVTAPPASAGPTPCGAAIPAPRAPSARSAAGPLAARRRPGRGPRSDHRRGRYPPGRLRLGGQGHLRRDSGGLAAGRVAGPPPGGSSGACPRQPAWAGEAPTRQFPTRPAVPEYRRRTPADLVPPRGTRSGRRPARPAGRPGGRGRRRSGRRGARRRPGRRGRAGAGRRRGLAAGRLGGRPAVVAPGLAGQAAERLDGAASWRGAGEVGVRAPPDDDQLVGPVVGVLGR